MLKPLKEVGGFGMCTSRIFGPNPPPPLPPIDRTSGAIMCLLACPLPTKCFILFLCVNAVSGLAASEAKTYTFTRSPTCAFVLGQSLVLHLAKKSRHCTAFFYCGPKPLAGYVLSPPPTVVCASAFPLKTQWKCSASEMKHGHRLY